MSMLGVIVNTLGIVVGSLLGLLLKKGIPEKVTAAVMTGLGLCTIYIGISGSLSGENVLIVIASMVLGAIAGTLLDIDGAVSKLGKLAESKFSKSGGSVAQGFVTASLLYCIGTMAIMGSLNASLSGDNSILFAKSLMDFCSAMMLSVSLGIGVMLSSVSVFVYQGLIVLLARYIEPFLSASAIAELSCVGSIMLIGLGLNIIDVTKIKVANYLPAIIFAPVICKIAELLSSLMS